MLLPCARHHDGGQSPNPVSCRRAGHARAHAGGQAGPLTLAAALQGRATVECRLKLREQRQDGVAGGTLRIVVRPKWQRRADPLTDLLPD